MDQGQGSYREARDIWDDHNKRQEFEHELIDRKTTWLLATQALLFAAYGVTFLGTGDSGRLEGFRDLVAYTGLFISATIFLGVLGLINSKWMSWKKYRDFFNDSLTIDLPRPLNGEPLQLGVKTGNTWLAMVPDYSIPVIFMFAWGLLTR